MYCSNCKNYVADGTTICPYCQTPLPQTGTQTNYYQQQAQQAPAYQQAPVYPQPMMNDQKYTNDLSTANTLGIIALIFGLLGVGIVAWICGAIGLGMSNSIPDLPQYADKKHKAKLLCIWGIIIPIIWSVIAIIAYVIFFASMASMY